MSTDSSRSFTTASSRSCPHTRGRPPVRGWKSRRGFATPGLVQHLSNFTYPTDRPRGDWPLARPEFTRNCQQFQNPPLRCGEITSRLCAVSPRGDSASGVADTSSAISY
jgi:hypothetical protein